MNARIGQRGALLLSRSWITSRLRMVDCIDAVEDGFRRLAAQQYAVPPVAAIPAVDGAFHLKCAADTGDDAPFALVKINGNFPGNGAHGLPTIQGVIGLFDARCGTLLALMDSAEITAIRTAAASAVAARHLARRDAQRLALIGCGLQARHHLAALAAVFDLRHVACVDRVPAAADALVGHAAALGLQAERVDTVQAATHAADLIVTTTTSRTPLLDDADVPCGAFVAAVGADNPHKQELHPALLAATCVVPDVLAQALAIGDLRHAVAAGAMTADMVHGDLAAIVTGAVPGRTDASQRFVFDSTGSAIEDLVLARQLYWQACEATDVPAWRLDL